LYTITGGEDRIGVFDLPGDADGDRDVDLNDLSALAGHYGDFTGVTWIDGDFDRDGDVDLSDLGTLAGNYGTGEAQAWTDFNSIAVPEPAMALTAYVVAMLARLGRGGR